VDRIVSIRLFDQSYTFKTDAEEAYVQQITTHVVREVEKARASGEVPGKLDTMILAALNIASEFFEAKRSREELRTKINGRCEALIDYIERNT